MLKIYRWLPAILVMITIFAFSSRTSGELPDFGVIDTLVKKSGHITEYALLACAIWFGFHSQEKKMWIAWVITVLYALTDEFHQSFVPTRHPSLIDVFVFDGSGAFLGLIFYRFWVKKKFPRFAGKR